MTALVREKLLSLVRAFFVLAPLALVSSARAAGVPNDCTQLIVGSAPGWNSMRGQLQLFERSARDSWRCRGPSMPVLFGKNGLAWGRGLAGEEGEGMGKVERDGPG